MTELTDAQIDAMPAGREMDALVAEAIGKAQCPCGAPYCAASYYVLGHCSTNIAAAWQVVIHFNRTHHWRICSPFTPGEPWVAGFTPHGTTGWNGVPDVQATGETAELAISRACLKATSRSKEAQR